jgi:hypothetical protein
MNFQGALTLLKEGKKLRRKSWLFFGFVSRAADGLAITGTKDAGLWRPNSSDLFADDWEIFQHEPGFIELSGLTGKLRFERGFFQWRDPSGAVTVTMKDLAEALRFARKEWRDPSGAVTVTMRDLGEEFRYSQKETSR